MSEPTSLCISKDTLIPSLQGEVMLSLLNKWEVKYVYYKKLAAPYGAANFL